MSTPPPIAIPFSTDQNIKNLESERSSLDSHHDNQFSRTHWIIQQLYNGRQTYSKEDDFVDYINTDSSIPLDYYPDRHQRLRQKLKGFFTARMECLVNDTPFNFKNRADTPVTFVYDQGPHPINYFKNAINGLFISDAIDTAPKITNPSQRPVFFNTPDIVIHGSYIGFNETIIDQVVFSDFRSFGDQVGCKVLVRANLSSSDQPNFRWYNLAQKFDTKNNALKSYIDLESVKRESPDYKRSNDRNTGFFIGNVNARNILEDISLKPILALFIVTAKVLGDFSSAIASSPTLTGRYTVYPLPEMFIHASGDRLCSLEASRQGAHAIKTIPRNKDGIIHIEYIPGVNGNEPINYVQRFNTIYTEIMKRFDDLLKDIDAFSIYKYKVDGNTVSADREQRLRMYISRLSREIRTAKTIVNRYIRYIRTIPGTDNKKYQTLYLQRLSIMPQAPLISIRTKEGYRKNLTANFKICRIPRNPNNDTGYFLSYDLRRDVNRIINNRVAGKRKSRRITHRRYRGGVKTSKEEALTDYNKFIDTIREKILDFTLSSFDISLDTNDKCKTDDISLDTNDKCKTPDIFIDIIFFIEKNYKSTEEFINLVKQNRHEVTNEEKALARTEDLENTYIEDYDEEFMKELEEAIENNKPEQIDPEVIKLMKSIKIEESETDTVMTNNETVKGEESETNTVMTDNETVKGKQPSTPSSRASTPNSEPQTLPINRYSDSESSQGGRKRKTYRRIRLF